MLLLSFMLLVFIDIVLSIVAAYNRVNDNDDNGFILLILFFIKNDDDDNNDSLFKEDDMIIRVIINNIKNILPILINIIALLFT